MCGRFTATFVEPQMIAARFAVSAPAIPEETLGRYNVCPTETIAAVVQPGEAAAVAWGLRPFRNGSFAPIDVRSETAAQRFKWLMTGGRCLVLADGWYEWLRPERPRGERVPFRYTVDSGAPFAFAGLWDETRVGGERIASVTVLTTAANSICAPVHDRMPCVLESAEAEAAWLSPDVDAQAALELLAVLAAVRTTAAPANPAVNKAGVEGAELLVVPEPAQLTLG